MRARVTAAAVAVAGALTLGGCSSFFSGSDQHASPATSSASGTPLMSVTRGSAAAGRTTCAYVPSDSGTPGRPVTPPAADEPTTGTVAVTVTIDGTAMPMHLDRASAPCTVAAVTALVQQKFYDDTPCHRITVPRGPEGLAVLQCGDPTGTGTSGPGFTIQDEKPTTLKAASTPGASLYPRGTVAMAKTSAPDSAGSQFFLVYADSALPPTYAVLGTVDPAGLPALDRIAAAGAKSADPSSPDNQKPRNEVRIGSAVVTG